MRTTRGVIVSLIALAALLVAAQAAQAATQSIPSSRFKSAKSCGCHADFVNTWGQSMHAKALEDPLYQAKLADANRATKGSLGAFCNTCHGPIATVSGEMKSGKLSAVGKEAITCEFCHKITGTSKPIGNASWVLDPAPARRAQLKDAKAPHPWAFSGFHNSSELCGTCHNVRHPVNNMHLEATYSEWAASPWAKERVTCQDCHMTPGAGVTKPYKGWAAAGAPEREHVYLMQWSGGNTSMGPKNSTEQMLKDAARFELTVPSVIAPSKTASVTVAITNEKAGHYLPTGLTEVRQMWLEVTGVDASGNEVLKERHDFGTVLKDAAGKHPVELWDAVGVYSDDRIAPRATRTFEYGLQMPEGGPVKVTAALYYRSAPEELAEKADVEVPTVTMASASKTAYGSAAALNEAQVQEVDEAAKGGSPMVFVMMLIGGAIVGLALVWGLWYALRK